MSSSKTPDPKYQATGKYFRFFQPSIRVRLTLLFAVIFGFTLVAYSVLLFRAFVQSQRDQFDAALFNHAVDVSQSIEIDFFGEITVNRDVLTAGDKIFPFAVGKSFVQLVTPEGKLIARSRTLSVNQLPIFPEDWKTLAAKGVVYRTLADREVPPVERGSNRGKYRMVTYAAQKSGSNDYVLQIAVPMLFIDRESRGLATFFLVTIPFALVIAIIGGLFLSKRALLPVSTIIEKTREIGATRLSERLPVPPVDDEVRELTLTLNGLFERLQAAFESQERFVADASHQLKTPLAILRGELDVLRSRPRTPEEIQEFTDSASQELLHLTRMVEDLLLLARIETGAAALSICPLRLDELVVDTTSRLERVASAKKIRIKVDLKTSEDEESREPFCIAGDPDLIRSLLQNLIENAIKFSPENSPIDVCVEDSTAFVEVRIKDRGPGIPADAQKRIFERFFRAENAGHLAEGTGLGLAIAKRIADAHCAILHASNRNDGSGACFLLQFQSVNALSQTS